MQGGEPAELFRAGGGGRDGGDDGGGGERGHQRCDIDAEAGDGGDTAKD